MPADNTKIKIIVCFNDLNQINALADTLYTEESISVERVFLDNRNHAFSSAAQAYNTALKNDSSTDVFIFCHQDIRFSRESICLISDACMAEQNSLFGVARVHNNGSDNWGKTVSTLRDGVMNWPSGSQYVDVFSLDECLLAGYKKVFDQVSFDEKVCDGWHLYGTDLCIQCHLLKKGVKVMDAKVAHLSHGKVDRAFIKTEGALSKKYRKEFTIISHTNGWTYTNPIKRDAMLLYRYFRYKWWKRS